jgi:hypothetical protein
MKRFARFRHLFYLVTLLFLLLQLNDVVGVQLHAQIAQSEQSGDTRSRVFEAVEGMQVEEVSGAKLLLAAYAMFWLLLFAYIVRIARMQDRTRDDLNRLERLLSKAETSNRDEDRSDNEEP